INEIQVVVLREGEKARHLLYVFDRYTDKNLGDAMFDLAHDTLGDYAVVFSADEKLAARGQALIQRALTLLILQSRFTRWRTEDINRMKLGRVLHNVFGNMDEDSRLDLKLTPNY